MKTPLLIQRVAVVIALVTSSVTAQAADGTWSAYSAGTYDWSTAGNWVSNSVANGSGSVANFATGATGTGTVEVTLDTARTVGGIVIGGTNYWTFSGANNLTLAGGSTPTINFNLFSSRTVTFNTVLAGNQGVTLSGTGIVILGAANLYTGDTRLSNSVALQAKNSQSLGAGSSNIYVATGSQVALDNGVTITGKTIHLTTGINPTGGLTTSGTAEWAGDLRVDAGARLGAGGANAQLTISGKISNGTANGLAVSSASGALGTTIFTAASDYTGTTTLYRGTVKLDGGNDRFPTGTTLDIGGTGDSILFDLNGRNQRVANVTTSLTGVGARTITNTSGTASVFTIQGTASSTYAGTIAGNLALVKAGANTQTLSGTSTYSGGTTINAGVLKVDGKIAGSTVVANGGTLGGGGSFGAVSVSDGGILSPGAAATLANPTAVSLSLASGGLVSVKIQGASGTSNAGVTYDQIKLEGTGSPSTVLTLNSTGSILKLAITGGFANKASAIDPYDPNGSNSTFSNYYLLNLTNGADQVSGRFAYVQDASGNQVVIDYESGRFNEINGIGTFVLNSQEYAISYQGDFATNSTLGGNDVVLTAIPETRTWILISCAAGILAIGGRFPRRCS